MSEKVTQSQIFQMLKDGANNFANKLKQHHEDLKVNVNEVYKSKCEDYKACESNDENKEK